MTNDQKSSLQSITICILVSVFLGALLDFLINGVLKIVWMVIYIPIYLVVCNMMLDHLSAKGLSSLRRYTVVAFSVGALVVHLVLVGRAHTRVYQMLLVSDKPVTLRSRDWPEVLIVSSAKLRELLSRQTGKEQKDVPVKISSITDYGCIRSYAVNSVDEVDVEFDPQASWTLRNDAKTLAEITGPESEDQWLPWCRIKFYRGPK
jgi:hypothetical protein